MMLIFLLVVGYLIYFIFNRDIVKYQENQKRCNACNSMISNGWEYCPFCGVRLKKEEGQYEEE